MYFLSNGKRELPCHLIDENDDFMAFLTIFPNTLGASVVIPKQHYSSYAFELSDQVLINLVLYTKQVALKLDRYFDDVGRTAMVFEGFGVDHVHAKLFPMHQTKIPMKNGSQLILQSISILMLMRAIFHRMMLEGRMIKRWHNWLKIFAQ